MPALLALVQVPPTPPSGEPGWWLLGLFGAAIPALWWYAREAHQGRLTDCRGEVAAIRKDMETGFASRDKHIEELRAEIGAVQREALASAKAQAEALAKSVEAAHERERMWMEAWGVAPAGSSAFHPPPSPPGRRPAKPEGRE